MAMITLWHNPRCSKSRQTLGLIEQAKVDVTIRRYMDDAPTKAELLAASKALGLRPIDMMRTGEAKFKELNLSKTSSNDDLLRAMAEFPVLIERPIAFKGTAAIIGRPPEAIKPLLAGGASR